MIHPFLGLANAVSGENSVGTPLLWGIFLGIVLFLLVLDLGVFHRKSREISLREALIWSAFWILLSLAFNGWIYFGFENGKQLGTDFFTAYLLEKALSVDNLFVFLLIFAHFQVPKEVQHRVLFWGIIGALVTRGIFILAGAALVASFSWILYLFGGFLVFVGIKLCYEGDPDVDPDKNLALRLYKRWFPATDQYHGASFFIREAGKRIATPLLLVLIVIETTDVLFAVDSIPAAFGVTTDPFIVFTSNIFAVLGLRALFFVLSGIMQKFIYLNIGLGLVLAFIGAKMLGEPWLWEHVPTWITLSIITTLIAGSMILSLFRQPKKES